MIAVLISVQNCPDPIDQDERDLQKDEDEVYVRGRIQYVICTTPSRFGAL